MSVTKELMKIMENENGRTDIYYDVSDKGIKAPEGIEHLEGWILGDNSNQPKQSTL